MTEEKVSRRGYVKRVGGLIVVAVAAAAGYSIYEATRPTPATPTPTSTPTLTPTSIAAPPRKSYEDVTLKLVTETGPFIAGPQYDHRDEWTAQTGGRIEVIEVPYTDLYSKIMTALTTGTKAYDILVAPSWATPDFSPYVAQLDEEIKQLVDYDEILYKANMMWGGHCYNVPLDGDHHMLFYNKRALENPDHQAAFREKYGYGVPAKDGFMEMITWEEYQDITEFFNKWDWFGDGKMHYGVIECCAPGTQTPFWFWDRTAAYNVLPGGPDQYHSVLYLDPETMDPLVDQEGFVKGLTNFVEITKYGVPGMLNFATRRLRSGFINGDAALAIDWPDIGPMSIDKKLSKIVGECGFGQLPGATTVWDRQNKKWVDATWGTKRDHARKQINHVPILDSGGWAGFIVKTAVNADAAFGYLKFMNSPQTSIKDVVRGSTGFNPYRKSHVANLKAWVDAGYTEDDAKAYLRAIERNISDPRAMPDLKIPGSAKYTGVIDIYTTKALAKEMSPKGACKAMYDEWQKITNDLGRDKQKKAYHEMLNIP
jgi:multiple sugar transport system substrate-binding protein